MAGLLDFMGGSIDDPRTAATLQLAQGLLAQRGMGGLVGGMQGYVGTMAQAKEAERRKKLEEEQRAQIAEERALRMQQLQRAMAEQEAQRAQAATDAGLLRTQFAQQAGPTQDGAPIQSGAFDPRMFLAQGGSTPALMTGLQLQQALTPAPKKRNVMNVNGHLVEVPETGAPQALWSAPKEPDKPPTSLQEFLEAQRNPVYDQWLLRGKRAAGTNVTVNTDNLGLKPKDRFEMEQKLAADYQGATKLDRGIVSTAQDISGLLKQPGSLKDQAAIYKFAKALDPDGAVREADYAAIVKTAGGLDYVKGLFNKALTGEQMLPKQRADMLNVVTGMANVASARLANEKKRFGENATMYNLKPENVFGREDNVINFSDLK